MNKRGQNRGFSLNNFLSENRRGQELSTSTIILIILGVIILVILVLGFTIGWDKIAPRLSSNNVETVSSQCLTACATNGIYDFCSRSFDLVSDKGTIKNSTCNYLSQKQAQYGIAACDSITCANILLINNIGPDGKALYTVKNFIASNINLCPADNTNAGKTLQTLIGNTVYTVTCPEVQAPQ